ncbi:MAG: SDR family NAD(P)-dependent oxidoreductase [Dehalococcoidia bacterium]|nr:SDR family NAD(P)-dependent oxidoreductase [Dehalococcoidia bacterium]
MDLKLKESKIVITGASRGIGKSIALAFASEGARLLLVARGQETLEQTKDELDQIGSSKVEILSCDVTTTAAPLEILRCAQDRLTGVDILVNNAGATIRDMETEENWRASFELNTFAPLLVMEALKDELMKSTHASVVNISSIFGREYGGPAQYQTSKAAQIALSNAYARDWITDGIRVNNIAPGSIAFEGGSWGNRLISDPEGMAEFIRAEIPGGRFGKPEEVADAVVWLASPRASWVIGTTLPVDGAQSRSGT